MQEKYHGINWDHHGCPSAECHRVATKIYRSNPQAFRTWWCWWGFFWKSNTVHSSAFTFSHRRWLCRGKNISYRTWSTSKWRECWRRHSNRHRNVGQSRFVHWINCMRLLSQMYFFKYFQWLRFTRIFYHYIYIWCWQWYLACRPIRTGRPLVVVRMDTYVCCCSSVRYGIDDSLLRPISRLLWWIRWPFTY